MKKLFYLAMLFIMTACESTGGDICGMYIC